MKTGVLMYVLFCLLLLSCSGGGTQSGNNADAKDSVPAAATANTSAKIKRVGMVTGIKPDKIAYYKQLHANAWPGVLKKLDECNIHNYSIYLQQIDNKYYLFSYFEYTGVDYDADMKKMAADTTTQRWWKETDPAQQPLPEAAAKQQIWTNMETVFHFN